eukprot:CAMPEP_0182439746 /NCGR_PEP_ID=MMETSP1167-20130531/86618_1 /TAXON_ID=2988 /ORGANISM="Mallomonas Sp, Strain CCMP3275" /LENGTH=357 /DNA_ID=CAMNT_0024633513 /DNA_START=504 /DNA_END=1574 /DNA_ORIENTATION=+
MRISSSSSPDAIDHTSLPLHLPVRERPLVHILLVQESMRENSLDVALPSLIQALTELHDDMHIILLSFSHRIGIYRFNTENASFSVQYVHMLWCNGQVREGQEICERENEEREREKYIMPVMPLSWACSFYDAVYRVGDVRSIFSSAIKNMYTSFTIQDTTRVDRSALEMSSTCENMLGAVLEAVTSWVMREYQGDGTDGEGYVFAAEDMYSGEEIEREKQDRGLFGMMTGFTSKLFSLGANERNERDVSYSSVSDLRSHMTGPVDKCSGVILHVYFGTPQDMPLQSHSSVSSIKMTPCPSTSLHNSTSTSTSSYSVPSSSSSSSPSSFSLSDMNKSLENKNKRERERERILVNDNW